MDQLWLWVGFNAFVLAMLAIDLGVFHRSAHEVSVKEAAIWSTVWVALALGFNYGIYHFMGEQAGLEFLAGYLIEKALSVDNIFVFVLIFSYFRVPPKYQHRVLFWGILGALVMRGVMIGLGAYLIHHFEWVLYVFGAFLVWTGYRMARQDERAIEPEANPVIRLVRRLVPVTGTYHGPSFFIREPAGIGGPARRLATPLFVVLVLVETTDLIFAVDSIPAVFAVTRDPFLVYSSNVFAILGLRALYFLLSGVIGKFRYLKFGLSVVLIFVGAKMLLADVYKVPIGLSLGVIALVIAPRSSSRSSSRRPRPLMIGLRRKDLNPWIRHIVLHRSCRQPTGTGLATEEPKGVSHVAVGVSMPERARHKKSIMARQEGQRMPPRAARTGGGRPQEGRVTAARERRPCRWRNTARSATSPGPASRRARRRRSRTSSRSSSCRSTTPRSMHYDFRLEADGVLKSWSVPKGPSMDPAVKRLAVQVEDHPIGYATFEGTIPQGQYGGGTVTIWDHGTYESLMDQKAEPQTAAEAIEAGRIEFVMHGERLKGKFALIRMKPRGKGKPQWLLMKLKDEFAEAGSEESPEARGEAQGRRQGGRPGPHEPDGKAPKTVELTHPDRVIYPEAGLTKADVFAYYEKVADRLLPFLKDRPITLERLPEGLAEEAPHFWQKDTPDYYPDWIPRIELETERGKTVHYALVNDKATLLYLVNQGTLPSTSGRRGSKDLDRPDFVLFDLDPGKALVRRRRRRGEGHQGDARRARASSRS